MSADSSGKMTFLAGSKGGIPLAWIVKGSCEAELDSLPLLALSPIIAIKGDSAKSSSRGTNFEVIQHFVPFGPFRRSFNRNLTCY